ncbi:MAG: YjbH domain-containing protein [Gammaproteobacteria bacterium]|nr:YjbH domain-containing protein [Gammaproteobacteria bacterium]
MRAALTCTLVLLLSSLVVPRVEASNFGVPGILDIPSARMNAESELALTYHRQDIADNFSLSYQATPWLQTAFRYTIFNPRGLDRSTDELKDRSFEVRARLWQERVWLPEVSVGIRDLVGTGAWNGEYIVASKAVGPLDLTMGLGWGRLAERDISSNPLSRISSRFSRRSSSTGLGGTFSFGDYFSGPDVGLFGGVRYQLPRWNLALEAAYNSDSYARERSRNTISDTDPWSFGIVWEPVENVTLGASWQQGNEVALRIGAAVNTSTRIARKPPNRYGAPGTEDAPARRPRRNQTWFARAASEAHTSGLLLRSAKVLDDSTLNVVYTNQDYQYEADAIRRLLALVNLYAPQQYGTVIVTGHQANVDTHSVHYTRPGRVGWAAEVDPSQEHREVTVMPPLRVEDPDFATPFRYPNGVWNAGLGLRPFLFDPDSPFRYQLYARIGAQVDFGSGWELSGSWVQNIYSQFDGISRESDSVLPRVRSDVIRYLQESSSRLDALMLTKRGQLTDEIYYLGFAGVLEEMYSGVGGEMLYRPFGSRFAFGANVIGVQQREFDGLLGLQDYRTVIGHLSVYWASPLYNFDVAVHAGRYLAKDVGATLELQKRFANGWSVGAFATLTDVPFKDFGEGSFDKGLIFRVPLNSYLGFNTRGAYSSILRPIQRDGGQRLHWGTTLWETLRGTHYDHLSQYRSRMMPQ